MRMIAIGFFALLGIGLVIQLIPYGRDHENPDVIREPAWDKPQTRELFERACKDCHSNQTEWPWYSSVAPISWLVQSDVEEGRSHFNVSEWGRNENHGDEAAGEGAGRYTHADTHTHTHTQRRKKNTHTHTAHTQHTHTQALVSARQAPRTTAGRRACPTPSPRPSAGWINWAWRRASGSRG